MNEALSINKRVNDDPLSFDRLRSESIDLLQQYSGDMWTDFNLHDPGITILEQLIYAITDLIYRSDFPVEDYLISNDSSLNLSDFALYDPEEIYPCRATTIEDYRKIIIDRVESVENVFISEYGKKSDNSIRGLYEILIKLDNTVQIDDKNAVVDEVKKIYAENRNLCEDIDSVSVINNIEYEICSNIEINGDIDPETILAEIYYKCHEYIAGNISIVKDEIYSDVVYMDEIFDGPYINQRTIGQTKISQKQTVFSISSLYTLINTIDGVDHVDELYLKNDNGKYYDVIIDDDCMSMCMRKPDPEHIEQIKLRKSNRVLSVRADEVYTKYNKLIFASKKLVSDEYSNVIRHASDYEEWRDFKDYESIQNNFPDTYGVNQYGVPASAPKDVHAKAKQLKSYLVIFEQLLISFLSNLDGVKKLFAITSLNEETYYTDQLYPNQLRGIDDIYPDNVLIQLKNMLRKYDDSIDRNNRLLDYLLALYAESFNQKSLRYYSYYEDHDLENVILTNKIKYLKSIVELGRDRGSAPNYENATNGSETYSGMQMRVSMLLGFSNFAVHSTTMHIIHQNLNILNHDEYKERLRQDNSSVYANLDEHEASLLFKFMKIEYMDSGEKIEVEYINKIMGESNPVVNNMLSDYLLRNGIYNDNYRVGKLGDNEKYTLVFRDDDRQWIKLGEYEELSDAHKSANILREFLVQLNKESESMHVVEHVLFRSKNNDTNLSESKLSFVVSVIFPAWTARCDDAEFRKLAEETVRINLPSHIVPVFHWYEFRTMYEFEILYIKWIKMKRDPDMSPEAIDECSNLIKSFLSSNLQ